MKKYVFSKKAKNFSFPIFDDFSLNHSNIYNLKKVLKENSIALISQKNKKLNKQIEDESINSKRSYLLNICKCLGKIRLHTNDKNSEIWDIKPSIEQNKDLARSHTMNEFLMHTDGSYEENPPNYMAIYTLRADKLGGGFSRLLSLEHLLKNISEETKLCLRNTFFDVRIPKEFYEEKQNLIVKTKILENDRIRFRSEIIIKDNLTKIQKKSLENFQEIIEKKNTAENFLINDDSILIFDNTKFLHGRTEVKDFQRHLMRIRFDFC